MPFLKNTTGFPALTPYLQRWRFKEIPPTTSFTLPRASYSFRYQFHKKPGPLTVYVEDYLFSQLTLEDEMQELVVETQEVRVHVWGLNVWGNNKLLEAVMWM